MQRGKNSNDSNASQFRFLLSELPQRFGTLSNRLDMHATPVRLFGSPWSCLRLLEHVCFVACPPSDWKMIDGRVLRSSIALPDDSGRIETSFVVAPGMICGDFVPDSEVTVNEYLWLAGILARWRENMDLAASSGKEIQ